MYANKLAIAVKSNGKVLREFKDTAFIPFGSEYSILIKNLNSVRVQVRVQVDGTDATEGTSLVIAPNSEMELKRFIKNGNLSEGNAFKFIERTSKIEQHKGIGVEDGLIRVEYQFERVMPTYYPPLRPQWRKVEYWEYDTFTAPSKDVYWDTFNRTLSSTGPLRSGLIQSASTQGATANSVTGQLYNASTQANALALNDVGITVPGQVVEQKFNAVAGFALETEKHVMVIKLLGETAEGKAISQPVTVKHKPKCTTCGHQNKHNAKFCSECGTALTIV